MSLYQGVRHREGTAVQDTTVTVDGEALDWRLDIANHSPSGLEWGYGGSGPAQLALAILAHHLKAPKLTQGQDEFDWPGSVRRAYDLHQPFKWKVVSHWRDDEWAITSADINKVIAEIDAEERHVRQRGELS